MLTFASRILEYNVQATDGELGKVKDIYFDEDNWVIRYLVIDTRKWLPGRKVLVSPISFDSVDFENGMVNILETKESIKDSPSLEEHEPISRKHEILLHAHFGWPHYWSYFDNNRLWGDFNTPHELGNTTETEVDKLTPEQEDERKLRSVNDIKGDFTGYTIQATDGEIGHVSDFMISDDSWKVRYFVVETKNLLAGKFVVLSVDWINSISWTDKRLVVDLPKDAIKNGPFFELDAPLTREEEMELYESFQRTPYF
ncbi:PRC-barrel domain-containing protein [Evansella sp. AB-rgal1]|uniref:PRC-barrel domain-containing protein n=1 Tax=Evansella sp. AB-rgal1 TaxID=3242696 RepID=UPI00359E083F